SLRWACRRSTWRHRSGLLVEPKILKSVAVVDAVDHDRHALEPRLPAMCRAGIEQGWPSIVLGQFFFDVPHHSFALLDIALHRLVVDHLVDLRTAIPAVISLSGADIVLVKDRIGVVDSGLSNVDTDLVVSAHDFRIPLGGFERLELGVEINLF